MAFRGLRKKYWDKVHNITVVKKKFLSLLSESKKKKRKNFEKGAQQCKSWLECPAMGSATQLRLTQVQDRPADTLSKLTNTLSMDSGAVISRHFFCITNIFEGLHIIFICKHFFIQKGKKK